jgi:hypothetical protein
MSISMDIFFPRIKARPNQNICSTKKKWWAFVGIRENVHCSGQRVYKNTKMKLSLGAKAIIIIVHYNGHWTSGGYSLVKTMRTRQSKCS